MLHKHLTFIARLFGTMLESPLYQQLLYFGVLLLLVTSWYWLLSSRDKAIRLLAVCLNLVCAASMGCIAGDFLYVAIGMLEIPSIAPGYVLVYITSAEMRNALRRTQRPE